jgi:NYN domain
MQCGLALRSADWKVSNMDIELTINAMVLADHVDQIVLFSGDGDFRSLIEAVQRRVVRVTLEEIHRSGCNGASCDAQMYTMGTLLRHGSEVQKRAICRRSHLESCVFSRSLSRASAWLTAD